MDCYYVRDTGTVLKITGTCWAEKYDELRMWSNAGCVTRSDPRWHSIMEELDDSKAWDDNNSERR